MVSTHAPDQDDRLDRRLAVPSAKLREGFLPNALLDERALHSLELCAEISDVDPLPPRATRVGLSLSGELCVTEV